MIYNDFQSDFYKEASFIPRFKISGKYWDKLPEAAQQAIMTGSLVVGGMGAGYGAGVLLNKGKENLQKRQDEMNIVDQKVASWTGFYDRDEYGDEKEAGAGSFIGRLFGKSKVPKGALKGPRNLGPRRKSVRGVTRVAPTKAPDEVLRPRTVNKPGQKVTKPVVPDATPTPPTPPTDAVTDAVENAPGIGQRILGAVSNNPGKSIAAGVGLTGVGFGAGAMMNRNKSRQY